MSATGGGVGSPKDKEYTTELRKAGYLAIYDHILSPCRAAALPLAPRRFDLDVDALSLNLEFYLEWERGDGTGYVTVLKGGAAGADKDSIFSSGCRQRCRGYPSLQGVAVYLPR